MPTLQEIAHAIDGDLHGPADLEITGIASLDRAGPADLAPVDSARFVSAMHDSAAGALLVSRDVEAGRDKPCIVADHALVSLNRVIEMLGLVRGNGRGGVHPTAVVDPDAYLDVTTLVSPYAVIEAGARIGARTVIGPHVVVEKGVVVGDDCFIAAGTVLHEGLVAGDRVVVGAHAVLSGPGFAYAAGPKGPIRIHHIGRVVLEDDVHIGAGTTVDRARFDETRIGRHTAIDSQVHVGHNSRIGQRTFIAGQTGMAGNARIGNDCEIGGQVGIGNHCGVGDGSRVAARSGLIRMFPEKSTLMWFPAHERPEALRMLAALRKLGRRGGKPG